MIHWKSFRFWKPLGFIFTTIPKPIHLRKNLLELPFLSVNSTPAISLNDSISARKVESLDVLKIVVSKIVCSLPNTEWAAANWNSWFPNPPLRSTIFFFLDTPYILSFKDWVYIVTMQKCGLSMKTVKLKNYFVAMSSCSKDHFVDADKNQES